MKVELIATKKGALSFVKLEEAERVGGSADFLDLMGGCQADTIVLGREDLAPAFFKLRTGVAGEILQKVSNYRKRLVVLGDFDGLESRALRDFIYESNRTGQVVFAADLESAIELLR
jgi:hypothetical protein